MASLNHCTFIGNLGADPDVRYTPGGTAVANFRIACTEKWKDRESGETKEETEWVRITAWSRLGEIAGEYLKKGSQVYIAGRMKTRKYTDKEGVERYTTEIIATELKMLGTRDGGGYRPKDEDAPPEARRGQGGGAPRTPPPQSGMPPDDFDDDIPFDHEAHDPR